MSVCVCIGELGEVGKSEKREVRGLVGKIRGHYLPCSFSISPAGGVALSLLPALWVAFTV